MRESRQIQTSADRPSGSGHLILAVVFGTAVVLFFGLGQLHLQFALADRAQSTRRLQARNLELDGRVRELRAEVESLKTPERLLEIARGELGMVDRAAGQASTLEVAADIEVRYRVPDPAAEGGAPPLSRPLELVARTAEATITPALDRIETGASRAQ